MSSGDAFKHSKTFQNKIVASLLVDGSFTRKMMPLIDSKYFESDSMKVIIGWIKEYYDEYKVVPSKDVFYHKMQQLPDIEKQLKFVLEDNLNKVYKEINSNDLEYVKEESFKYFDNQNWKNIIEKCIGLVKSEEYDSIRSMVNEANRISFGVDLGHIYMDDVDERYKTMIRNPITTGYPVLDTYFGGGFGKGDLACFIAPSGVGKTWLLCNMGANAIKQGKTVVHYSLELTNEYVGKRYDTILSEIPMDMLPNKVDDLKTHLSQHDEYGNLVIKFYPMKSVTCNGIRSHMEQLKLEGIYPDLVIIDYGDLLKPVKVRRNDEKRTELETVFENLKNLAQEMEVPVLTATQTNRKALTKEVIQADSISEAYNKVFPSDFIITFSRKLKDKIKDTGKLHIEKNRYGQDGITFDVKTDLSKGLIEVGNINTQATLKASTEEDNIMNTVKERYSMHKEQNRQKTSEKFKDFG